MRKLLILLLAGASSVLYSQNPLEKTLGDFTEVKVFDLIEVNLIKSDENKVMITGKDVEDVQVINNNGKLKIRMHIDKIFNGERTFVAVHYTTLDIIDANEGAFISSNELIEQPVIELRAQEGGRIKVGLDVGKAEIRSVTGGIVMASGTADLQTIVLNTGGIYEGRELLTERTKVTVRAAGEAEVKATGMVDAKIRAGGDIDIYGNPKTVNRSTFLGGRIRVKN